MAGKLFSATCTYQYKRLPLLGSFINGTFLAALLMSAAIEGIQTCFHIEHSRGHNDKTIVSDNYTVIVCGFALVGLIMQYCSLKVHELREEELCSESLLDLTSSERTSDLTSGCHGYELTTSLHKKDGQVSKDVVAIRELNATDLIAQRSAANQLTKLSNKRRSYDLNSNGLQQADSSLHQSLQELPLTIRSQEIPEDTADSARISLKSLRFSMNLESLSPFEVTQPDRDLEASSSSGHQSDSFHKHMRRVRSSLNRDNWFLVRCLASPVALIACGAIFALVEDELITEIADAALAVSVVLLLFAASYPPMKKAGKILLQTVPAGVNIERLRQELALSSCYILGVQDLHVWSLTPQSNRVGSCRLILDREFVNTKSQVEQILKEATYKFLEQRIKCTAIEPELQTRQQQQHQAASETS